MISDMEIQRIKNLPDHDTCARIEMQIINKFLPRRNCNEQRVGRSKAFS